MIDQQTEILAILPNLRRFALSLTGNLADADDALQSTVERLLERGWPADADVLPWSLKVCRNLWFDELRSRKVRRAASDDPAVIGEQVLEGEQQVHGEMALTEVQQALMTLPAEQRSVLELVAIEGYSYKQAAEVLEVPIGTIMSRLARARALLVERSGRNQDPAKRPGGEQG